MQVGRAWKIPLTRMQIWYCVGERKERFRLQCHLLLFYVCFFVCLFFIHLCELTLETS